MADLTPEQTAEALLSEPAANDNAPEVDLPPLSPRAIERLVPVLARFLAARIRPTLQATEGESAPNKAA